MFKLCNDPSFQGNSFVEQFCPKVLFAIFRKVSSAAGRQHVDERWIPGLSQVILNYWIKCFQSFKDYFSWTIGSNASNYSKNISKYSCHIKSFSLLLFNLFENFTLRASSAFATALVELCFASRYSAQCPIAVQCCLMPSFVRNLFLLNFLFSILIQPPCFLVGSPFVLPKISSITLSHRFPSFFQGLEETQQENCS